MAKTIVMPLGPEALSPSVQGPKVSSPTTVSLRVASLSCLMVLTGAVIT